MGAEMLEPEAIAVRSGCCYPTLRVIAQRPAKELSERKNTANFHSTVKFTNFLLLLFIFKFQLNSLFAWLFFSPKFPGHP